MDNAKLFKMLDNPAGLGDANITEEDLPFSVEAIASVQNCNLIFTSSLKIGTLVGLLETEDPRLDLELRRQRTPNPKRIPAMAEYLQGETWIYSALSVALTGSFHFKPVARDAGSSSRLGVLRIPRGFKARPVIVDGQHRFLSLKAVLGLDPDFQRYALPQHRRLALAEESVPVVFYVMGDHQEGLRRSQQLFYDLNFLGVSAARSLGIYFDGRTLENVMAVRIADRVKTFVGRIEKEFSTCDRKNVKLFTLSALQAATERLLGPISKENFDRQFDFALDYWDTVGATFDEWRSLPGYSVRELFVHGHGLALRALGEYGARLCRAKPHDWKQHLPKLRGVDWRRWECDMDGRPRLDADGRRVPNRCWEGVALIGPKIQNTRANVQATADFLCRETAIAEAISAGSKN